MVVLVVCNDDVFGVIVLQDILCVDVVIVISELNVLGVKGVIFIGDNLCVVVVIVGELGLEFKVGLLLEDKVKVVIELN